jgi:hypothetical protein
VPHEVVADSRPDRALQHLFELYFLLLEAIAQMIVLDLGSRFQRFRLRMRRYQALHWVHYSLWEILQISQMIISLIYL